MLNVRQFRQLVIRPALEPLGLWSQLVENLIVGTALQESGLFHLQQEPHGPALGFFQMEPKTYDWLYTKLIEHPLRAKILRICGFSEIPEDPMAMVWNLRYAVILCRFRYLEVKAPLPEVINVNQIAKYWKTYYNSSEGAGTVEEFITNYNKNNQN